MLQLSQVLRHEAAGAVARMQAGLQLKNLIFSKDQRVKQAYSERWLSSQLETREAIKENCLASIGSELTNHSTAAQCVACIACIELPLNLWPSLLQRLLANMLQVEDTSTTNHSKPAVRQATLEAIGYICQDLQPASVLAAQSNEILTAIVHGMRPEETHEAVQLAAVTALFNSLDFIQANMQQPVERDHILQAVCQCTQLEASVRARVVALQCLVKMVGLYYGLLEAYMSAALFPISLRAIDSADPDVALQGIEFWSSVCDEELLLDQLEEEDGVSASGGGSRHYARGALSFLLPPLLARLSGVSVDQLMVASTPGTSPPSVGQHEDEDEWSPSKAAGVCLMLLAQCCREEILPAVRPFLQAHFTSADWRLREAACFTFGAVLEGPGELQVRALINEGLGGLIGLLIAESSAGPTACVPVLDTAAWSVGRVFELMPDTALAGELEAPLIGCLLRGLEAAQPRVAVNMCWALHHFSVGSSWVARNNNNNNINGKSANQQSLADAPPTYRLSAHFPALLEALVRCADRPDANIRSLRHAAFATLAELVRGSAGDCYPAVQQATSLLVTRLRSVGHTLTQVNEKSRDSAVQQEGLFEQQSLLCGALEAALRRLDIGDVLAAADGLMETLLSMLALTAAAAAASSGGAAAGGGDEAAAAAAGCGAQEDVLLALSALVDRMPAAVCTRYMASMQPLLLHCLRVHASSATGQSVQVCRNAIGLVSDLCRILAKEMAPMAEPVLSCMMELLTNASTDKSLRPAIISVFGDFAMALEEGFSVYLSVVLTTLHQAGQARVDREDVELSEYLRELRLSCLEAYSSILHGLRSPSGSSDQALANQMQPSFTSILQLLSVVAAEEPSDELVRSACGLIGDLASVFGAGLLPSLQAAGLDRLLALGQGSKIPRTRTNALWASKALTQTTAVGQLA